MQLAHLTISQVLGHKGKFQLKKKQGYDHTLTGQGYFTDVK
jgi:hypothetical protein